MKNLCSKASLHIAMSQHRPLSIAENVKFTGETKPHFILRVRGQFFAPNVLNIPEYLP